MQPLTESDYVKLLFNEPFTPVEVNEGTIDQRPFAFCTPTFTSVTTNCAIVVLRPMQSQEHIFPFDDPCIYLNRFEGFLFFTDEGRRTLFVYRPDPEDETKDISCAYGLCGDAEQLVACFPCKDNAIYAVTTTSVIRLTPQIKSREITYEFIHRTSPITKAWKQDHCLLLQIGGEEYFTFDLKEKIFTPASAYAYFGEENTLVAVDSKRTVAALKAKDIATFANQWIFDDSSKSPLTSIDIAQNYIVLNREKGCREATILNKDSGEQVLELKREGKMHFFAVRLFGNVAVELRGKKNKTQNEYLFQAIHIPSKAIIAQKAVLIGERITDFHFSYHKLLYVSESLTDRTLHQITI